MSRAATNRTTPVIDRRRAARAGATSASSQGLLEAKLLIPRSRRGTVRRSRLLRQLRGARDRRVISVIAPPGYGKTSLLVQWVARDTRATAWLTADDGDNDPVVFLTYLAVAIDRVLPIDPDIVRSIERGAVLERAVVGRLLVALEQSGTPILVVIDDAHGLTSHASLDALAEFITYLPRTCQVAVVARGPISLPFARWRTDGSLLELGPADLAMDPEEVAQLGRQLGLALSTEAAAELARQTEGWPALLALAATETEVTTARGGGTRADPDRLIADYLRSELLEGRPETEIAFLTRTSILGQLSGPLCDVVADRTGSSRVLADLGRSTLLIDEYGGSYRYHTLLRDFLQEELAAREPGLVPDLHRRAAGWYAENDRRDLAVEHAFASGDLDLAAALVGQGMVGHHWSGRRATTRAWFRRFTDAALEERPWLAVIAAWEELGAGDVASTERLANIAERGSFAGRPPDGTVSFESGRAMLRAAMFRDGADAAQRNAVRAADLEVAGGRWRDFALWQVAIARVATGDRSGADDALGEAAAAARSADNIGLAHCVLGHRALLAADRLDWNAARRYGSESDEIAEAVSLVGYLSTAPARAAHIRLAIQAGDIAGARRDLALATNLRPLLTGACPGLAVQSLLAFARAHLAVGDPAGARTLLTQASQVIHSHPDLGVLPDEVADLRATISALPVGLDGASSLTAAEVRVLGLLPYYLSFKEIAQRLGVKATTVKTHALAIYGKLGASTRGEAVAIASEAGLLERFPT
jgi:LuxR family maltose regulon positive regulatory protein